MIMLMFSEKVIRLEILEYMPILFIFLMCTLIVSLTIF